MVPADHRTIHDHTAPTLAAPVGLPRELIYFYLVAPVLMAPVFRRDIFEHQARDILTQIAGNYVPFVAIPLALHAVYRFVVPRVPLPPLALWRRLAVHAGLSAVVASIVAVAMHRPFLIVSAGRTPLTGFAASCVILTWMFILPTLVVQELRDRTSAMERRLSAERQATLRAQLDAIQSRTNPHFLFNALNTIASLVRDDPDLAERTLERVSDLLRYALESVRLEAVPLGLELAMVTDYLEVQRARFGDGLTYGIRVQPGLQEQMLPPLLLQPLVENAVLHGVAGGAGGRIRIEARRRGEKIELRVEDDGPGPGRSAHEGSSTGLRDLRQRLALLFGNDHSLAMRTNERGGCSVDMAVPSFDRAGSPGSRRNEAP
jgi:two-component system sensor histidine kinase AlgZ